MRIRLNNGNEHAVNRASKIYDIERGVYILDVFMTGANVNDRYDALINDLKVPDNLTNLVVVGDFGDLTFDKVALSYSSLNIYGDSLEGYFDIAISE